jgi:tRNA (guanine-N7-)-methyltransferase
MAERRREPTRRIEREFGVPIAGEIVPEVRWTQTGVRKLPPDRPLVWNQYFGRTAPLVLDLGCGNGRYLLYSSVWRADHDHFGIDSLPLVIRYATRRGNQRGLTNVRFAVADAASFMARMVEPGSVSELHCYHPQPYDFPAQVSRRLLTPRFLADVHTSLRADGLIVLQTDHPGYWRYLMEVVPAFFAFEPRQERWPDAPKGRTRREIIALKRGLAVFRGVGRPRNDLTKEAKTELVASLPRPIFVADPSSHSLDAIEAETSRGRHP